MSGLQHITPHFIHGDKVPMHTIPGVSVNTLMASSTTADHELSSHIVQWRFNMMGIQKDACDPVLCMNNEKQTLTRYQSARMYANKHTQVLYTPDVYTNTYSMFYHGCTPKQTMNSASPLK